MQVGTRPIGPDAMPVSLLGFGCGAVGGLVVRGAQADRERAVARAIEAGINYFDTAVAYGNGASERHLGDVLRKLRATDVIIGTKVRSLEDGARRDFVVKVRGQEGANPERDLTVPDITGELWRRAFNTYGLPQEWIDSLRVSSAAILFVRAHSKLNLQPMDWVTARDHLQEHDVDDENEEQDDDEDYGDDEDEDGNPKAIAEEAVALTVIPTLEADQANAQDDSEHSGEAEEVAITKDGLPAQVGFASSSATCRSFWPTARTEVSPASPSW